MEDTSSAGNPRVPGRVLSDVPAQSARCAGNGASRMVRAELDCVVSGRKSDITWRTIECARNGASATRREGSSRALPDGRFRTRRSSLSSSRPPRQVCWTCPASEFTPRPCCWSPPATTPSESPPRLPIGPDPPEQVRLLTQRRDVGQTVAAVSEHHRQLRQHDSRVMGRAAPSSVDHRSRQPGRQPDPISQFGEQQRTRVRGHTLPSPVTFSRRAARVSFTSEVPSRSL